MTSGPDFGATRDSASAADSKLDLAHCITWFEATEPCGKDFELQPDGTVTKTSRVAPSAMNALLVYVPGIEELAGLLGHVAARPNAGLILNAFHGVGVGKPFLILSMAQLARRLGVQVDAQGHVADADRPRLVGVHELDGISYAARMKENCAPCAWVLLDRDIDKHTPASFNDANLPYDAWLRLMDERLLPGLSTCGRVFSPSASARVYRISGEPIAGGNGHTFMRVTQPERVQAIGTQLPFKAHAAGLAWAKPILSKATGEAISKRTTTLLDLSVWIPGRLVFEGQPHAGQGLVVGRPTITTHPGPALDLSGFTDLTREEIERINAASPTKLARDADGRYSLHDYDTLQLTTVIEPQGGKPMTVADWMANGAKRTRIQSPFRASHSFAAFINRSPRGHVYLYDSGTQTVFHLAAPIGPGGADGAISSEDFFAYLPTHTYLYTTTREPWPAASVNARLSPVRTGPSAKDTMSASAWLDRHRPIVQLVWHPGEPELIEDRVLQVAGWVHKAGDRVFNLYRPPSSIDGDATQAGPWRKHLELLYPDDADHITRWLAHRVQRPGEKINHALVLIGAQGIGKDTLLAPVTEGVGAWNRADISPVQLLGRFNSWVKSVLLVISEARDLGDHDRFAFYEHSKTYLATPPDVLRVDEKNLREHYVVNVMGVVFTSNNALDGLYLPADDRRHYVAASDLPASAEVERACHELHRWYEQGGVGHVVAYLRQLDLQEFDPKAPPLKTAAFWRIVQAGEAPEAGELRDVIDRLRNPAALTLEKIRSEALAQGMLELIAELSKRRAVPHKLSRAGYLQIRNPDAGDGLFLVETRRQAIYAKKGLSAAEQLRAARRLQAECFL